MFVGADGLTKPALRSGQKSGKNPSTVWVMVNLFSDGSGDISWTKLYSRLASYPELPSGASGSGGGADKDDDDNDNDNDEDVKELLTDLSNMVVDEEGGVKIKNGRGHPKKFG